MESYSYAAEAQTLSLNAKRRACRIDWVDPAMYFVSRFLSASSVLRSSGALTYMKVCGNVLLLSWWCTVDCGRHAARSDDDCCQVIF